MNILHISPYVPSVHTGHAGGVCMGKQVEELRKHHTVFVLSFVNDEKDEELAIKEYSDGNSWFIKSSTVDKAGNALMHLNKPLFFSIRSSRSFKKRFLKILETYSIDVIHAEYTAMGQYYWVKKYYPNIQFNVVEHDVTRQSYERQVKDSSGLKRLFNVWQKNLVVSKEKEYWSHADTIFTFNEKDKTLLNSYYGFNNVRQLVPYYGVDFEHAFDKPVEKEPKSICFVGQMARKENHDAAMRLIRLVKELGREDIKVNIIGAHPSKELMDQECDNVHVTGFVDSIEDEIRKNTLAVFPLMLGAGIKLKVLLTCGLGVPVITTGIGAEGIDEEGKVLCLAETDDEIKKYILNLIDNQEKLDRLAENSKQFVEKQFNWDKTQEVFKQVYPYLPKENTL